MDSLLYCPEIFQNLLYLFSIGEFLLSRVEYLYFVFTTFHGTMQKALIQEGRDAIVRSTFRMCVGAVLSD